MEQRGIGTSLLITANTVSILSQLNLTVATVRRGDSNQKISFIEKARAMGANALLSLYTHTGSQFDQCLKDLKILEIGDGKVKYIIPVEKHLHNADQKIFTVVLFVHDDVVGTLALLGKGSDKTQE